MSTVIQMPRPGDIKAVVASEIRSLMGRYGVSQIQLADVVGITQSQLSKRLRGDITMDIVELSRIADFFQVTVADLVGGTTKNPRPGGPDGGLSEDVRHQGLEPRTRWFRAALDMPTLAAA